MESIGGDGKPAHLLVIPDGQHSHIVPMLRLAKQFARKGITVTFVNSAFQISGLGLAESSSELQGLDFRIISLRNPEKRTAPLTRDRARIDLQQAFEQQLMEKMVRDKISGVPGGPTSILSDMFQPWTQDVAHKLHIPRYMFVPSGVIFAKHMQGFADLFEHGDLRASEKDGNLVKFDGQVFIPGLPPLRYHEFNRFSKAQTATFLWCCKSLWESAGVLVNSFYELEEKVIESWPTPGHPAIEHKKVPKIYPVGPLFSESISETNTTVIPGLEDSADKSLSFLGSQPTSSVLYVAFGSQARLSPGQITELAHGLERSNQRFLWVLPQPKASSNEETRSITTLLPPGFEARIGDRGCIVTGWAPQRQILAHSSTGCFLTHAGWNSTLESIMSGVPMIAWPQGAEQDLNCRYLVDILKIADQIRSGAENIAERSEIERAVRLLMVGSEGKAMRSKAEEFQRMGEGAVAVGGSRSRAVEEFMHDIISRHHA